MLGNAQSLREESHTGGLLEYPQYTRPRTFRGMEVPPVLLSGNHAEIARWRRQQSLLRTRALRPDLFEKHELTAEDRALLAEADEDEGVYVAFSDPPPRDMSEEPSAPAESHRAPRTPAA
jgi:tRNA (guanine37-N1)-methyltransferase